MISSENSFRKTPTLILSNVKQEAVSRDMMLYFKEYLTGIHDQDCVCDRDS